MLITYDDFKARADAIRAEIAEACAAARRPVAEVALLAVTKTHPPAAAEYAARYGLLAVGENRVQDGVEKRALVQASIRWELIGHLQSNKARLAAAHFDRVQTVDSEKILGHLDRAAKECGKILPILIQVNAGRDPAKSGVELAAAPALVELALTNANLRLDGFMTIAPLSPDPDVALRTFEALRDLRDRLVGQLGRPFAQLSMGMSGDFRTAIRAGSTSVRIGSALFGTRSSPPQ
jgi:pyridoxal phosphate enzyme (YggS family)